MPQLLQKNENFREAIENKNIEDYAIFLDEEIEKLDKMEQIIIALLNSKNSYLIFGVDLHSENIVGLDMCRGERDIFKINMNKNFSEVLFQYPDYFEYKFIDVEDGRNNRSDNLCILLIIIIISDRFVCVFSTREHSVKICAFDS